MGSRECSSVRKALWSIRLGRRIRSISTLDSERANRGVTRQTDLPGDPTARVGKLELDREHLLALGRNKAAGQRDRRLGRPELIACPSWVDARPAHILGFEK